MVGPSPIPFLSFPLQKGLFSNQPCQPGSVQQTPSTPPSFLDTWGLTYIENEEGIGTAVELGQLVPDLVHEVAVTWVACDTGGVDRGDGKGAPCPVFPVQNQQQGDNSWEQAKVSHEQMERMFLISSGKTAFQLDLPLAWPFLVLTTSLHLFLSVSPSPDL